MIDNTDGEALALERNRIYADCNPLQHAEQLGTRAAIARINQKRPRGPNTSIDSYLGESMFMQPGTKPADFLNKGCTLYNTYDPCGMCATMLLLCKMKRIAYLFDDKDYEGAYETMRTYFKGRDSAKERLALLAESNNPLNRGAVLIARLRDKVTALQAQGVPLVRTLDSDECRGDLQQATMLLVDVDEGDLTTKGDELTRNARTLRDIKRLCNIN